MVFVDRVTPQFIPLDAWITALCELHLCKYLTWWTQNQTCNLLISIPNPMEGKFSGILLTARLESAYIRHQGQNITKIFSSTDSMDSLAIKHHQMINTTKIMTWILCEYCDVYIMLHHNRVVKLHTNMNPMTTYNWLNYMIKYRIFVHQFHTVSYNSMSAYHPGLNFISYICEHTYFKNPALWSSSTYTSLYDPIY